MICIVSLKNNEISKIKTKNRWKCNCLKLLHQWVKYCFSCWQNLYTKHLGISIRYQRDKTPTYTFRGQWSALWINAIYFSQLYISLHSYKHCIFYLSCLSRRIPLQYHTLVSQFNTGQRHSKKPLTVPHTQPRHIWRYNVEFEISHL